MTTRPIVAVGLRAAGDHPAAWRLTVEPNGDGLRQGLDSLSGLVDGTTYVLAAQVAERGGVDLITFGATLEAPPDAPGRVTTELDSVGLAARTAAATSHIGLVPTVTTTHTEPFHVQASIATLDWISHGRAGWAVDVSTTHEAATAVGRRGVAPAAQLWDEAGDVIEVSRKLWDSWEDDAVIRDVASGRFIDRDRLHYVDHEGPTFSVRGPSIVPRPPQGHPVTVVTVTDEASLGTAAYADVVLLPLEGERDLAERIRQVRRLVADAGRDTRELRVLVTASVLLADDDESADRRAEELDDLADRPHEIDVVGTAQSLVDHLRAWLRDGSDGVHVRPAVTAVDLPRLLDDVVTQLGTTQYAAGPGGPAPTLRERLGLRRPLNQYTSQTL